MDRTVKLRTFSSFLPMFTHLIALLSQERNSNIYIAVSFFNLFHHYNRRAYGCKTYFLLRQLFIY